MISAKQVSYQQFLIRELERRRRRNSGYSLRAFARDLGLPATKLSEALNRKCGFSARRAGEVANRLGLSGSEKDLFIGLVEKDHSRSQSGKNRAKERVEKILEQSDFQEIDLERFRVISDWYHFAILELTDVEDFKYSPNWIANRLGISVKAAREAVQRLLDFGLLREDDVRGVRQTQADLATPSGIPSREIREQHSQLLEIAQRSLEKDPIEERDFSAITLAIDPDDIEKAHRLIKEFRRKLNKELSLASKKKRVFCLGIQLFPLDQKES